MGASFVMLGRESRSGFPPLCDRLNVRVALHLVGMGNIESVFTTFSTGRQTVFFVGGGERMWSVPVSRDDSLPVDALRRVLGHGDRSRPAVGPQATLRGRFFFGGFLPGDGG